MGWELVARGQGGPPGGHGETVSVALQRPAAGKSPFAQLFVRVGRARCAALGWRKGDRVELHRGTGADAGKLRIVPSDLPKGLSLSLQPNGIGGALAVRVSVASLPGLPNRAEASQGVEVALVVEVPGRGDGRHGLEIVLPPWEIDYHRGRAVAPAIVASRAVRGRPNGGWSR